VLTYLYGRQDVTVNAKNEHTAQSYPEKHLPQFSFSVLLVFELKQTDRRARREVQGLNYDNHHHHHHRGHAPGWNVAVFTSCVRHPRSPASRRAEFRSG